MCAGDARGFQYGFRSRTLIEARDVLGDSAVEERDILRQVADVPPEVIGIPLVEGGVVDPHDTAGGRPYTDQCPRQRGLSRCTGTEQGEAATGVERERGIRDDNSPAAG